ncbi:MAG: 1,6-anhydro-N-acetylmuramyl-L-alanine amidase AmpD [Betaproteobacteria bacterium]|nr:1,6-anhydro-N-acetylmuramyl-L-alanine amidase AmpD [Betaproteobacteria bacterium]NBY70980.1 1,6-anhydro-N-acetylmuramyl-L-alanine amidase AmpD [Betaproteobacteria bacterium]
MPDDPSLPLWSKGWYRFARRLDSPNFGPRPELPPTAEKSGSTTGRAAVDLIVVHSISLPPGQYGGHQVQQLFTNQLDWGQHPYFQSIRGLQVSAHFYIERSGALWQLVSCDHRAWHAGASNHQGRDNCNDFSVGIELEGLEGDLFEAPQYETLAALCAALGQAYGIEHMAGHEHIAPGRKSDPGMGFDWKGLQRQLGWPDRCFP